MKKLTAVVATNSSWESLYAIRFTWRPPCFINRMMMFGDQRTTNVKVTAKRSFDNFRFFWCFFVNLASSVLLMVKIIQWKFHFEYSPKNRGDSCVPNGYSIDIWEKWPFPLYGSFKDFEPSPSLTAKSYYCKSLANYWSKTAKKRKNPYRYSLNIVNIVNPYRVSNKRGVAGVKMLFWNKKQVKGVVQNK